mmetsp:Transcript_4333/g.6069  ORF Transcript_4333/g.6069 Transcript_4333/m.6069 type:complete len:549 (+) Transcript_4333:683-2329(+)
METQEKQSETDLLVSDLIIKQKPVQCILRKSSILWKETSATSKKPPTEVRLNDVVGVEQHKSQQNCFILYTFPLSNPKSTNRERKIFPFLCPDNEITQKWIKGIRCALRGVTLESEPPMYRLTIFVNPAGGKGKALEVWNSVKEMFEIADVRVTVIQTTHAGHAYSYCNTMDTTATDGVVCVSGDGLLYEVVNGIMKRPDWETAIKLPLGIIPGGSGNGLAASLGAGDALNAAFHIIKAHVHPLDLWSVLYANGEQRAYTFLSLTWSTVAEIDKESEKYRWMGNARFTFTGVKKIVEGKRKHTAKLSYLIDVEHEKQIQQELSNNPSPTRNRSLSVPIKVAGNKIQQSTQHSKCHVTASSTICPTCSPGVRRLELSSSQTNSNSNSNTDSQPDNSNDNQPNETKDETNSIPSGPPLKYLNNPIYKEQFVSTEGDFDFLIMTNVGKLSTTVHAAPFAHLNDGFMDLIFAKKLNRAKLTQLLLALDSGEFVSMKDIEYHKVKAIVFEPVVDTGVIMLDGEPLAVQPVQVEVHNSLATVFAPPVEPSKGAI